MIAGLLAVFADRSLKAVPHVRLSDRTMVNAAAFLDRLASGLALGPTLDYATGTEFACRCFLQSKAIVIVHALGWKEHDEEAGTMSEQTQADSVPETGTGIDQGQPIPAQVFRPGQHTPWPPNQVAGQSSGAQKIYMGPSTIPSSTFTTPGKILPLPPPGNLHMHTPQHFR